MTREYFIAAVSESGSECLTRFVRAETWEDAWSELRRLAREKWAGQIWRPTSVTEQSDIAEIPYRLQVLAGNAELGMRNAECGKGAV